MNEVLKCHDDYARKYHRRVLQSKRHYSILKASPFGYEGHITSIVLHDLDLMVPREPISERIGLLASNIIQKFICK